MKERIIGKVISVDSFRVFIRLDDELKSLYKSGYEDIYEVARINSYIIIPVGSDKIVALVTSVKTLDETELNKSKDSIFLTKPSRYLVATMIGTISDGKYIQGVYNYPILDNPIWYITKNDLDKIFDQHIKGAIDYKEDYYLPIGTSPAFKDYEVKINPDKFFGKHAAILGNTGSGKSCTLTSILQSLFSYDYYGQKLKSSHIIIFDTNGEYAQAFQGTEGNPSSFLKEVNPFVINKNGLKVPFWFMNFDDYEYLFTPSAQTQIPVLKRAIGLAKNKGYAKETKLIPQSYISKLNTLVAECDENNFKIKGTIFNELEGFIKDLKLLDSDFDKTKILDSLSQLLVEKKKLTQNGSYINGYVSTAILTSVSSEISSELNEYSSMLSHKEVAEDKSIDLPIQFNFSELISTYLDEAIRVLQSTGDNKLRENISTLSMRLQSFLSDYRLSQTLLFNQETPIIESLAKFLSFVLGDFGKIYHSSTDDDYFQKYFSSHDNIDKTGHSSQITIIDMSLLPYEVLETITGLIGRLILEFVSRFPESKRAVMPLVLVLEEAQNYIPENNRGDRESISKKVFERIAREGRKYGVSLVVSSQRPSELSKTVLSQCNSFIIHRLQNPEDQKYVRQLVSAANEDILRQLPILPQQHVVILGDAVKTPVQVRMRTANPRPNSNNPEFINKWLQDSLIGPDDYEEITQSWEKGNKETQSSPIAAPLD